MVQGDLTGCVIVLYNPDKRLLGEVLASVLPQVDSLFVCDNSPAGREVDIPKDEKVVYKWMGGNAGIAAAQNEGIRYFMNHGFGNIFFIDQDTLIPGAIVDSLKLSVNELKRKNIEVGAVGPRVINRESGQAYRGLVKTGTDYNRHLTEVSELISSGSLVPVANFKTAGLMEERLFIDGVDHEWCWRCAVKSGGRFFIDESATVEHHVGDGDRRVLGRRIPVHSPMRCYYQYRNYFLLIRRPYVPRYWKISRCAKYLIRAIYFPLFVKPRWRYAVNIFKGILSGIVGK